MLAAMLEELTAAGVRVCILSYNARATIVEALCAVGLVRHQHATNSLASNALTAFDCFLALPDSTAFAAPNTTIFC